MAEYQNGLDYRGGKPVRSEDVNRDVQTGRAVHYNKEYYNDDDSYKVKVDQCVKEGYHLYDAEPKPEPV